MGTIPKFPKVSPCRSPVTGVSGKVRGPLPGLQGPWETNTYALARAVPHWALAEPAPVARHLTTQVPGTLGKRDRWVSSAGVLCRPQDANGPPPAASAGEGLILDLTPLEPREMLARFSEHKARGTLGKLRLIIPPDFSLRFFRWVQESIEELRQVLVEVTEPVITLNTKLADGGDFKKNELSVLHDLGERVDTHLRNMRESCDLWETVISAYIANQVSTKAKEMDLYGHRFHDLGPWLMEFSNLSGDIRKLCKQRPLDPNELKTLGRVDS